MAATLLLGPALRADASLRGTVRDATGAAIADAHLVAARPAGARAVRDDVGRRWHLTLDSLPRPLMSVRIEAPGFTPVDLTARDSLASC